MTQQQLLEVFSCPCNPGFNWKNKNTFKAHFNSKRHKQHSTTELELDHRKRITRLQIELDKITAEHLKLKELYFKLLYEYDTLKKKHEAPPPPDENACYLP